MPRSSRAAYFRFVIQSHISQCVLVCGTRFKPLATFYPNTSAWLMDIEQNIQEPLPLRCKRKQTFLYYLIERALSGRGIGLLCLAMPTYAA
jgi:hypothetical protein